MLLRHAKSDWSELGARDHERTLAARGREAAPQLGAYMAGHGLLPDRVVCSTAIRARETWDLVAAALPGHRQVVYDERLYAAEADGILAVARDTPDAVQSLLLVGHNPGLKDFAEWMIAGGDAGARGRLSQKLPTGALVVIDFPIDAWHRLQPAAGRIDRLVTPRSLDSASD
jgi:phosphohistidine phosphatase